MKNNDTRQAERVPIYIFFFLTKTYFLKNVLTTMRAQYAMVSVLFDEYIIILTRRIYWTAVWPTRCI